MTALAEENPKWGYRLIHRLLVAEGWLVNEERRERSGCQVGLQLPPYGAKPHGQKAIGEDADSI